MNRRARIGELLSQMVPLSGHDVEEILQEQSSNPRKFGEIALAWGLCRPEHVWDAWCQQSDDGEVILDLDRVGIDAGAAALLPSDVARRLNVITVRAANDVVLVATAGEPSVETAGKLQALLQRRIKFARADGAQLAAMIEAYYPLAV